MIEVRATVTMSGISAGDMALVDERDPEIQKLLENEWLVPLYERYEPPDEG